MRALLVHPGVHFSVADVWRGWHRALDRLGVNVASFNFDDRIEFYNQALLNIGGETRRAFDYEASVRMAANGLKAALYEFWPDVLIVVSGFFVPPEIYPLIRSRHHKVVILFTESPYEDERQIERASLCDLALVNDPTNLEQFQAATEAWYVPHAYDPEIHSPGPAEPDLTSDCCFVGTAYPSRQEFLEAVDWSGIDLALAGNWRSLSDDSPLVKHVAHAKNECLENVDAVRMYRSAKTSLNLYRKESFDGGLSEPGWAMGPREVELAATETFFLREPRPEGDELFPFLPTFTEPGELGEKLRWWLDPRRDTKRKARAVMARDAIQDRTFDAHAKKVLEHLT